MKQLELGPGTNPRVSKDVTEYIGLEASQEACNACISLNIPNTKFYKCNLGFEPIPLSDDWADFILGDQFLEHVPRLGYKFHNGQIITFNPLIDLLNEIWRISKNNAIIQFNVPKWNSQEQWQDPTHQSAIPPNFWKYFDPHDEWNLKSSYAIKASFVLSKIGDGGWYDVFQLRAIK